MTRPSDGKSIRDRTTKLPLPEEKENRMKANCWYGKGDVQIVDVSEPEILNSRDAVIKVTSTAICGSDLHLYNGLVPTMEKGDILGHEFMGEVVEVGNEVHKVKAGDRVVASFPISCGNCFFCQKELFFAL
jgi:threonine dehydrogenase-like Zn-dependent dehydrogenase